MTGERVIVLYMLIYTPVAQLDRVPDFEPPY